jgi:hypothetical protein
MSVARRSFRFVGAALVTALVIVLADHLWFVGGIGE